MEIDIEIREVSLEPVVEDVYRATTNTDIDKRWWIRTSVVLSKPLREAVQLMANKYKTGMSTIIRLALLYTLVENRDHFESWLRWVLEKDPVM